MKVITTFFKTRAKKLIVPIILSLLGSFISVKSIFILKNIINCTLKQHVLPIPKLIIVLTLIIISASISATSSFLFAKIANNWIFHVQKQLVHKILNAKKQNLITYSNGNLTSIIVNDIFQLEKLAENIIPESITNIFHILFILISMIILNLKFTIITFFIMLIIFCLYIPLGNKTSKYSYKMQTGIGNLNDFAYKFLKELDLIKSNNYQNKIEEKNKILTDDLKNTSISTAKIIAMLSPFISTMLLLGMGTLMVLGIYLISINQITVGTLISFFTFIFQLLPLLMDLGEKFINFTDTKGALIRIQHIYKLQQETDFNTSKSLINKKVNKLVFENVFYQYPQNHDFKLNNISFQAKEGEITAIVGPSGSGKSTIFNLIERFYYLNNKNGNIKLKFNNNFQNINNISLKNLRNLIAYMPQKEYILSGTIYENIIAGVTNNKISNKKINTLLKEFKLYNLIQSLPDGLQTNINEKGVSLSIGQEQRIKLINMILTNKKIILLDEPTAALDSESEKIIHNYLNKIKSNKIIITISHNLSNIIDADNIIFIDNGYITGQGAHCDLYNNHSKYKNFIDNQLKLQNTN